MQMRYHGPQHLLTKLRAHTIFHYKGDGSKYGGGGGAVVVADAAAVVAVVVVTAVAAAAKVASAYRRQN